MRTPRSLIPLAQAGADGRSWYTNAHSQLLAASRTLSVPPQRLADLLALFSPRVTVLRSIRHTLYYLDTRRFYPDCMTPIRTAVLHYERTGEIRGRKTSAFARALMLDPSAVVLDVWMARALCVPQKPLEGLHFHTKARDRIVATANLLHWPASETQAAIWHAVVRDWGRTPTPFTILPLLAS